MQLIVLNVEGSAERRLRWRGEERRIHPPKEMKSRSSAEYAGHPPPILCKEVPCFHQVTYECGVQSPLVIEVSRRVLSGKDLGGKGQGNQRKRCRRPVSHSFAVSPVQFIKDEENG